MSTDDSPPTPSPTWPLLPPELEVKKGAPFAQDRLKRKVEADQLTTLIQHSPTPLVLSLDGAWGTGKSTFVRMWRQELEDGGFKTIYFNAWETDFIAEPLVALVGEVGALLPARTQAAKATYKKLKAATALILKKGTPAAVRLLTAGLIDAKPEDLRGLDPEELKKALSETAEKVVEGAIDKYRRHRDDVAAFRKALLEAVAAAGQGRPLVYFIDELDRCRPTFAVELLERVKHLFEVPGVVFVLSVHREQLAHSLQAIYGQSFDAEGYLGRFFHLNYRLTESTSSDYTKHLFEQVGFRNWTAVATAVAFLMDYLGLTLRQQQRCVTWVSLVLRIIAKGRSKDDPWVFSLLPVIREWQPKLYNDFVSGKKSADDLIETLEAVDPLRWLADTETVQVETSLLQLEIDRRRSHAQGQDRVPWRSRRLERYTDDRASSTSTGAGTPPPPSRGEQILQTIEFSRLSADAYFIRSNQWQRALSILELRERFQILDENPSA